MPHADGAIASIVRGDHGDPFAILGMHAEPSGELAVRAFLPQASRVEVIDASSGRSVAELTAVDSAGFFAGTIADRVERFPYRLRLTIGNSTNEIEDPYRFGPVLGDVDTYLMAEGTHRRLYERLGAHPMQMDGIDGVGFAVWAPNAQRVSVVGDFNDWDGRRHPMRKQIGPGVWEIFLPHVTEGAVYKYELLSSDGTLLPLKADPFAFASERPPATASIVTEADKHVWHDGEWFTRRAEANDRHSPMAIYEVHLGSWKRADGNRYLTYDEFADDLVGYASAMGFTHIELLPVSEYPFDGSWGYQPIGLFAPTSRFGTPEQFANFVDKAHAAGIGIILDWVPGHFPTDEHGLGLFDGTHLYEHADPRQGFQPDWNTLIYNFGRTEVVNFLISNALFWLDRYHVDGVRVDAVASILYLDYSRKAGEWIPNQFGGNENLGAIDFLRRMNEQVFGDEPGVTTIAEESTSWPGVSQPVYNGGLGFGYKWNMGWMHDSLAYISTDPIYRAYHQNEITFSFVYAFSENFVLPISHDEVVHGKGSLIGKMPGDDWQRFANLRSYLGFMYAHPGKKLLFMGCEFAQWREWNHDRSLDWHLLEEPQHASIQALVRDLNFTYRSIPALHERDNEPGGFEWIDGSDTASNVVAFIRRGLEPDAFAVVVASFSPVVHEGYRIGVPAMGRYIEAMNTDATRYGGSGVGSGASVRAEEIPAHGKPYSILVNLPPLATQILIVAK